MDNFVDVLVDGGWNRVAGQDVGLNLEDEDVLEIEGCCSECEKFCDTIAGR